MSYICLFMGAKLDATLEFALPECACVLACLLPSLKPAAHRTSRRTGVGEHTDIEKRDRK